MDTQTVSNAQTVLLALDPQHFPELDGSRQTLIAGAKHPDNPVLRPRPGHWDATRCKVYGTVLFDPGDRLFKMWYSGTTDTPENIRRSEGSTRHVGYAFSHDGVRWERPTLGVIDFDGRRDNNLVLLDAQAPSVFIQEHEKDPDRRFLMLAEAGLHTNRNKVLFSADGIRWTAGPVPPMDSGEHGPKVHEPYSILFDPKEPDKSKRWKGYSLLHMNRNGYRGRAVGLFVSEDPSRWREWETQPILSADTGMESEIHLPHVSRFYDTYVMLYDAMEPNHHTQTEIAVGDDGIRFRRVQNGVKVVPNGDAGAHDAGKVCVSPRSLFEHDGKIWWYYTTSADTYQTAPRNLLCTPWFRYTCLAQWRLDGFACIEPIERNASAHATTAPLRPTRREPLHVWINARAPSAQEAIIVELLDGEHVIARSQPFVGDQLRAQVTWHQPPPLVQPSQSLRLRICLNGNARLYALGTNLVRDASTSTTTPVDSPIANCKSTTADPSVPRPIWTFHAEHKISATPAADHDTVYFGSWDQHLYALDLASGKVKWKFKTGNAITTSPTCHGGTVYAASRDGHLYALDRNSGAVRWQTNVSTGQLSVSANGAWIDASPAIGTWGTSPGSNESAERIFVGCHNRDLHAFELTSGEERWRFPTFNWILSKPAIANHRVYFGSMDGHIYCLDARCGALHWRYRVGSKLKYAPTVVPGSVSLQAVCGSPLIDGDTLYCGADDGFLYALDADTGREKWIYQTRKWIWGRPAIARGTLVVASADGTVSGLSPDAGEHRWSIQTENANYGDVIPHRGGCVLVASTSGKLHALEPTRGTVAWTYDAGAPIRCAPTAAPKDAILIATCKGSLTYLQ